MKKEDALPWLEDLRRRYKDDRPPYYTFESLQFNRAWTTELESAIKAIFPENHSVIRHFDRAFGNSGPHVFWDDYFSNLSLIGILDASISLLKGNRLWSMIDAIRAESESELLDQAEMLLASGYRVAATVIAGGALESSLKRYVGKHGLSYNGSGSISIYNNAVGQKRKADPTSGLYSTTDGKLIDVWGGHRNDAAHDPGNFARSKEDVERMIGGIREFISRLS